MTDMKIGIIGAGGRMGQACIRQVTETSGCSVVAASDIAGSPATGNDAGEAAGAGTLGIDVDLFEGHPTVAILVPGAVGLGLGLGLGIRLT